MKLYKNTVNITLNNKTFDIRYAHTNDEEYNIEANIIMYSIKNFPLKIKETRIWDDLKTNHDFKHKFKSIKEFKNFCYNLYD
jgi:hypothetical protein